MLFANVAHALDERAVNVYLYLNLNHCQSIDFLDIGLNIQAPFSI